MKNMFKFLPLVPAMIIAASTVFFSFDVMTMVVVLVVLSVIAAGCVALAVYFIVLILQDVYGKIMKQRQTI
ncbi:MULTISPECIES: hypothetical protein [Morganellaceae]|uniref:Uncharacterized protein n=1 Tax=Moellerella wisconsensis TaxID=158849 RepID=A0A9Q8Q5N4_9GAMM|nr:MULTISPECIES: hypothetical protein [Morganellaceae]UNH29048.1 hypothetical protein MNY64_17575 [Moellerella wisconsensis]UNH32392.1 hypothetical protein MNY72_16815 [Moellerella wisconsensis]